MPGAHVYWEYRPVGNTAPPEIVPAIVRKLTAQRVTIEIVVKGERTHRTARPDALTPRLQPDRELGETE